MSNFDQNGKEYVEEIRKIEPTDPAHADVINALAQDIINNEAFLKKISEKHLDDMENPHNVTPAQIGAEAMYVNEVDLSDTSVYNENTWYPVVGSNVITDNNLLKKGYRRIKCNVSLNSGTHPSWSSHDSGFSCNLEILAVMGQWGCAVANTIVLDYTFSQCTDNPLGYTQITTGNNPVIYCRGGGKYYMYSEFPEQRWTPYTTETGYGGMTVKPVSSCPGIFNTKKATLIADLDGNAATATKATQDGNGDIIADTYAKIKVIKTEWGARIIQTTPETSIFKSDITNLVPGYTYIGSFVTTHGYGDNKNEIGNYYVGRNGDNLMMTYYSPYDHEIINSNTIYSVFMKL